MRPLIVDHPVAADYQSPSGGSESLMHPQAHGAVGFVTPQQIFPPPMFPGPTGDNVAAVSSTAAKSPPTTPSQVLEHSEIATSRQVAMSPIIPEVPYLVTPSPTLVTSETTIPGQVNNVLSTIPESPLVTPPQVLEPPQIVTPSHFAVSPMVPEPPLLAPSSIAIPLTVLEPSRAIEPQGFTDRRQVFDSSQVIDNHQPVTSVYKRRDETNATTATESRRNSIEGAPDIILTLGGSGYDIMTSTTPSSPAPSPDELATPSSQLSLEEFPIPMDVESGVSEGASGKSGRFYFAPRVIPDFEIDRSDLPSWLLECGRFDLVISVEAGDIWERLITAWIRQERRLGFGLDEKIVCQKFCCSP